LDSAGYLSRSAASRAAAVSIILGGHAAALLAVLTLGGLGVAVDRAPMLVSVLTEAAPAKPAIPLRTLPPLRLVTPEITVPDMPRIDLPSAVESVERTAPAAPRLSVATAAAADGAAAIEPPRADLAYLNNPPPPYPAMSKRMGEQGRVLLRVRVGARGEVEEVRIESTSGHERLDEAALDAVRRWRFAPARIGQQAVAGWALVPVHFALRG
jgi:protein TonB